MTAFRNSILSTLAFYDAVGGVPLTKIELYKYFMGSPPMKLGDFLHALEESQSTLITRINCFRGFYFLKKNTHGYARRVHGGKSSIKKWAIARRVLKALSVLPYVRMIAVTGSLALNNTKTQSDIDLLIAAKSGRIWTTRLLISALTHLMGKRRHGARIADRICLNHYLSDRGLEMRPRNLFSAHICTSFAVLWSSAKTAQNLLWQNSAFITSYFPHAFAATHLLRKDAIKSSPKLLYSAARVIECLVNRFFGNALETLCKKIQLIKIKNSIVRQNLKENEIICDDSALVFHHPRPKNQEALYLYHQNLKELVISH